MKYLMYCITVLTLIFLFVFSIFVFLCTENANFNAGKTEIEIINDYGFSHSDFVKKIEKACESADVDIMFSCLTYEENTNKEKEMIIFKTNNSENFLPVKTKTGNILLSADDAYSTDISLIADNFTKNKLIFIDFFYDYTIYPLSAITSQQVKKSQCLANTSDLVRLSDALIEQNLSMNQGLATYENDDSLIKILYAGLAVMLVLTLFSIIFYQLSISRNIAVKRLDGYNSGMIISEILKDFIIFYISAVGICFLSMLIFFVSVSDIELFGFYLEKNIKIILFTLLSIISLYILSCFNIFTINPLNILKGKAKGQKIHILTIVSKFVIVAVLLTMCNENVSSFKEYYNNMKSYKNISSQLENYYTITNTKFSENMDEDYKKFYKLTHYTNEAVMMCAMMCGRPQMEKNIIQWFVTINDNYMKLNPIYTPDGKEIKYNDIKDEKATILIPDGIYSEQDVLRIHSGRFEGIGEEDIKIHTYDRNQKFYVFETIKTKYPGYIMYPIVFIHKDGYSVFSAISNGEIIFKSHTNNFNIEITPLLRECNIDWITGSTPSVESIYTSYINNTKLEVIVYSIIIVVFLFLLVCVIFYESFLYYKHNQKKFTIMKMNGYSFSEMHGFQIFIHIILYLFILYISNAMKLNIVFSGVVIALDYIMFYSILESKTAEYSSKILKGS